MMTHKFGAKLDTARSTTNVLNQSSSKETCGLEPLFRCGTFWLCIHMADGLGVRIQKSLKNLSSFATGT